MENKQDEEEKKPWPIIRTYVDEKGNTVKVAKPAYAAESMSKFTKEIGDPEE